MKGWSFPSGTPGWLLRHPLLLAEWLAARNLLGRARAHVAAVIIAGVAAIGALAVILLTLRSQVAAVFNALLTYRILTVVAIGLYAAFAVARQRQRAELRYTQFWLAAAPVRQFSRTLATLVVSLLPLAAQLLAICILFGAMGLVGEVSLAIVGETALWVAGATALGAAIGWWTARRAHAEALEGSRYVAAVKRRDHSVPSAAGLSGWPLAQVRAWGRPENLRVLVMAAALLGVQAGSSALVGLSVVATWVLGGYLGGLLTAVLRTAREAAQWLRSTPIPFAQFAWAVTRRALVHQVVGTAVTAGLLVILGAPWASALYAGAMWLAIVVLGCSIGVADSYHARRPLVKMALSLAVLAVVEVREHGWSIPLAALLAAWHLRAGAKT
jgi:hypothetical protein